MFKWLQMQQRYERRLRRIPALYKTTLLFKKRGQLVSGTKIWANLELIWAFF